MDDKLDNEPELQAEIRDLQQVAIKIKLYY
jgi:hypothetical protein